LYTPPPFVVSANGARGIRNPWSTMENIRSFRGSVLSRALPEGLVTWK